MRITLFSALLFVVQMSFAQSFMPAYNSTFSNDIEVTLNDGTIQKGKVVIYGMKRMTIKLENGEKIKVGVMDMKQYRLPAPKSTVLKLLSMGNSTSSVNELLNTDFKTALNTDYFVFKRLLDKKGKPFMAQLINPGFDNHMQVYLDPNAKETGGGKLTGGLVGGEDKSYYISKGIGSAALFVEKKRYKKSFTTIFEGCPEISSRFGEKPEWDDVATHVFFYDQICNK